MNSFQPSDTLKALTHCPWCEHQFKDPQIYLVAERDSLQLFHFECSSCQTNILAAVSLNGMSVTSVGVISDLGQGDVHRLLEAQQIQADDVIQLHQLLDRPDFVCKFKTINLRP